VAEINNTDVSNNQNEAAKTKAPEVKEDKLTENKKTGDLNIEKQTTKTPVKKARKQSEHGLYVGLIVSPDISTIKFQSIKNIGVSAGVLVGYQINKTISIESGVLWSIKNYYSEGKYFSVKNIYLPAGASIKKVSGECNMIEVPLVAKYNFRSSGKSNFSASAGISSYFMKKEDYNYQVDRNGLQYPYSTSYKNTSTDVFAVANFAAGYNRQVKKNIKLRIEPYVKIPLQGVGIGSLPIMSTGLNIGVTKKISR
jgi:hypothetical protein